MTQDEKIDLLVREVQSLKETLAKQGEQLDYVVKRLNHMRSKAHEAREKQPAWPK